MPGKLNKQMDAKVRRVVTEPDNNLFLRDGENSARTNQNYRSFSA
jgi:hypothetical protein